MAGRMHEQYRRDLFRLMHVALETPHHRRRSNSLEVVPQWFGWGIRRAVSLGSRMNYVVTRDEEARDLAADDDFYAAVVR